ncbi:uncharacterized protein LOC133197114 [Saccostrea echinata]|uniref:uncharacterized protein LOC133197114 n=1 Tax=Saccostrea echinata TaxID=191078 RepID=UPI002A7F928C|nr:uncharacterized protein LOC133197114 [Saccostrea echinata]
MSASESKRTKAKAKSISRALEFCSGCVSATTLKEARNHYSFLSDLAKNLGITVKEQLRTQTKDTRFRYLTDDDKKLGGALFDTLYKVGDRVNLTDVWPNYLFLIEVYKRHQGISSARVRIEEVMDSKESKSAITEILQDSEMMGYDRKTLKEARKQYDSIMSNQFSSFGTELQTNLDKNKKTKIEPQHISSAHMKTAPELYRIISEAWGNRRDIAEEAIREFFYIMQTYHRLKKDHHTPTTYDETKSSRTSTASSSMVSAKLFSTNCIESVLQRCSQKYQKDLLKKAEQEFKQLKKIDKELKYRKDLEKRKNEWHMKGSEGPLELLRSIPRPERPLHKVLQHAKDDNTMDSELALLEYGSLLHSENLFQEVESPTAISEQAAGTSASVYKPSEKKSIGDILNKMKNIVNPEVYKNAKEEYQKLQDIEKMIARDDSLRVRKDKWKIHNIDGTFGYINVEIPNRPLHIVLNRAQKEGIKGSEFALMDYGSMLHSEVLYDSKDNMTQMAPMPQEFKKSGSVQAKHGNVENIRELQPVRMVPEEGRIQREREGSRCDEEQMFMLQQEIDKLNEQLNIKNTEIEDLTTRLSQAASNSLMYNNPSIADLSDKNRPTKLGERFGQLYDNEWSEAYETLKISIPSENIIYSILAEVVKDIFQYCEKALQQQIADIKHDLEKRTREPRFFDDKKSFSGIGKTDEMLSWMCEKYATEFQKGNAVYSVQGLTKIYKDYCKHRQFLNSYPGIMEKIESYVNLAVELCWLMCAQTPPMQLLFARRNDKVDKTYFRCMGHSGDKVDICIWPAVLLHDGGPVVMKGQILPL